MRCSDNERVGGALAVLDELVPGGNGGASLWKCNVWRRAAEEREGACVQQSTAAHRDGQRVLQLSVRFRQQLRQRTGGVQCALPEHPPAQLTPRSISPAARMSVLSPRQMKHASPSRFGCGAERNNGGGVNGGDWLITHSCHRADAECCE